MAQLESNLQGIEGLLNLLIQDLARLSPDAQNEKAGSAWVQELEAFRVRASTIRRILDRFHDAELSTRRYLREHLDEEFEALQRSYDALKAEFMEEDQNLKQGSSQWNGWSLPASAPLSELS